MSDSSSRGGTYTVDAEPVPDWELVVLVMDWMVRIEPVGERVLERSGIDTARSSTSLHIQKRHVRNIRSANEMLMDVPDRTDPSHPLPRALRTKPLNPIRVQQLEGAQRLHQAHLPNNDLPWSNTISSSSLLALHPRGDSADVVLRGRMHRGRH